MLRVYDGAQYDETALAALGIDAATCPTLDEWFTENAVVSPAEPVRKRRGRKPAESPDPNAPVDPNAPAA